MTAPDYHLREEVAAPRERVPVENPGELVRSDRGQFALVPRLEQEGLVERHDDVVRAQIDADRLEAYPA